MKRKWVILIAVMLATLAMLACFSGHREDPVKVSGNLSPIDVAQITRVVRRDMMARILPDISWQSIKSLPRRIKDYRRSKLQSISVSEDGSVAVWGETQPFSGGISTFQDRSAFAWGGAQAQSGAVVSDMFDYTLAKGPGGWKIVPARWFRGTP